MKKTVLLIFLFLLQHSYAQSDYRKGFLIDKNKDTIRGFINYTISSSKFEKIDFKRNLTDKKTVYTPEDILGYGIGNSEFFSSRFINDKDYNKKYFIEHLIEGKLSLYKVSSSFFVEKDTLFTRLKNDSKEVTIKNVDYVSSIKGYHKVFNFLLADCNKINRSKLLKIKYSQIQFVELINKYNSCFNESSVVFKQNKPWFQLNLGVFAGYSFTSIKNNRDNIGSYFDNLNTSSNYLVYGGFIEMGSPRIVERLSFYTGAIFNSFDYYNYAIRTSLLIEVNGSVKQINIPLALRYTFPEKKYTPYISAGLLNSINLTNESTWSADRTNSSIIITSLENYNANTNSIGLMANIGFKKKITQKLSGFAELHYQQINITKSRENGRDSYKSTNSNLQVLIGIRF